MNAANILNLIWCHTYWSLSKNILKPGYLKTLTHHSIFVVNVHCNNINNESLYRYRWFSVIVHKFSECLQFPFTLSTLYVLMFLQIIESSISYHSHFPFLPFTLEPTLVFPILNHITQSHHSIYVVNIHSTFQI